MTPQDLVVKHGNKMCDGKVSADLSQLFKDLLEVRDSNDDKLHTYKSCIQDLLNIIDHGYDPHSFYDIDHVRHARFLCKDD